MAKTIYIITESHKDSPDEFERARFTSRSQADEEFANCVEGADHEAYEESLQRIDPYWHTYSLNEVEVDEDGNEEFVDCKLAVTSKIYLRGHETERKHL